MYKIAKENLTALFQKIAADQELYLPVRTADQVNFGVWTEEADVDLDCFKKCEISQRRILSPERDFVYLYPGRKEAPCRAGGLKGAEFCGVWYESL